MRRADREITDITEIEKILKKGNILHLSFNNGDYPYMLTVNYGYHMKDGVPELFFHGSKEGEKHAVIEKDARTSFEIDCETIFLQPVGDSVCTSSFAYGSMIGQGITEAVPEEEKEQYLTDLMRHFGIESVYFNPVSLADTKVYRIKVTSFTAKRRENKR